MAERKISEKSLENLKRFNQENKAITRESIEISLLQLLEKKDLKKDDRDIDLQNFRRQIADV